MQPKELLFSDIAPRSVPEEARDVTVLLWVITKYQSQQL